MLPAPYVQAALFLSRLELYGLVNFMIDTGADNTTLSLSDIERINVPYRRLKRDSLVEVEGIGGMHKFYKEEGALILRDSEGITYTFALDVHIPCRGTANDAERQRQLPSILGRDITNLCSMTVSFQLGTVELIPPEGARLPAPTRRLL